MNLAVGHLSSAMGETAAAKAVGVQDMILEWANECLREVLQSGVKVEVPFYKRALEHVASVKSDWQTRITLEHEKHPDQNLLMRSVSSGTFGIIFTVRPNAASSRLQ